MDMSETELIDELWVHVENLAYDAITLQIYLLHKKECLDQLGTKICTGYLNRIGDSIDQHTSEISQLKDIFQRKGQLQ